MRQAGELDLQLKEMEVVEISLRIDFYLHSEFTIRDLFLFYCSGGPQVRTQQPGQDGEGVVGG